MSSSKHAIESTHQQSTALKSTLHTSATGHGRAKLHLYMNFDNVYTEL